MELTSDRLILQHLGIDDAPEMLKIRAHPQINQFIGRTPPKDVEDIEVFIEKIKIETEKSNTLFWTIRQRREKAIMGTICLWNIDRSAQKAELGYELLPEYQGNGFMSEAIQTVLVEGFDNQGFREISAYTHKDNEPSIRLLKKIGFHFHPEIEDKDFPDNRVYIKQAPE